MGLLSDLMFHPSEVVSMFRFKYGGHLPSSPSLTQPYAACAATMSASCFSYALLNAVSRSFAIVIQQLPPALRDATAVFYLVLRGLDTVEDDMLLSTEVKLPLLLEFYKRMNEDKNFHIDGVGDTDEYRLLLSHFDRVLVLYNELPEQYRTVITEITKRMGAGMAEFVNKGLNSATSTSSSIDAHSDYNLYCHYVAGLVGLGLSQLFEASSLITSQLSANTAMWNDMGVFLQKINILRDYREDVDVQRCWWPKEIWSKHAHALTDFKSKEEKYVTAGRACLNELLVDALTHVPSCVQYLSLLHESEGVFRFCAIPQMMALATLCEIFDNKQVFQAPVKMRKGQTCEILMYTRSMSDFITKITQMLLVLRKKITNMPEGPIRDKGLALLAKIDEMIIASTPVNTTRETGAGVGVRLIKTDDRVAAAQRSWPVYISAALAAVVIPVLIISRKAIEANIAPDHGL